METNKNQEKTLDVAKQRKIFRIICSILVAVAIWVYVDEEKTVNVKMSVNDLPVEFASEDTALADKNLMLLSGYNTTVDLVLKGPRKVLWKLNKDEIRIVADTAGIQDTGMQSLTYEVVFPNNVPQSQIQVEKASIYAVNVTVGELYTKEVPIRCEVTGKIADGYIAEDLVLDPAVLVLRAQRDDLLNVSYAKVYVNINGLQETMIRTVEYQLYDYNDIPIQNENIRAASKLIQVTLPVKAVKSVPLALNFVEAVGSTMEQVEYTFEPSGTVLLQGDKTVLDSIENILLDTIYLQDLEDEQTLEYTISVPDGVEVVGDETEVTVTITMTGVSERRISTDHFVTVNLAEGLAASVVTESLSVMLRGFTEELDAMDGSNLTVTADLSAITQAGTYTLPVTVRVDGYRNVGIKGTYQVIVAVEAVTVEDDPTADPGVDPQAAVPAAASLDPEVPADDPQTNTQIDTLSDGKGEISAA